MIVGESHWCSNLFTWNLTMDSLPYVSIAANQHAFIKNGLRPTTFLLRFMMLWQHE